MKRVGPGEFGTIFLSRDLITDKLHLMEVANKSRVAGNVLNKVVHVEKLLEGVEGVDALEASWEDSANLYMVRVSILLWLCGQYRWLTLTLSHTSLVPPSPWTP
jgi:hypothetical protein